MRPLQAAMLAALLTGQDPLIIASRFNLPVATVETLRERYSLTAPVRRANYISDLLVTFVEQEFASLMAISIATSDEVWIQSQNAQDLAILIGVKHDRLMRIFEAWSHPNGTGPKEIDMDPPDPPVAPDPMLSGGRDDGVEVLYAEG